MTHKEVMSVEKNEEIFGEFRREAGQIPHHVKYKAEPAYELVDHYKEHIPVLESIVRQGSRGEDALKFISNSRGRSLRAQLRERGVASVGLEPYEKSMGSLYPFEEEYDLFIWIPEDRGGDTSVVTFAHEVGHTFDPRVDNRDAEIFCEAFAHLWLKQPGVRLKIELLLAKCPTKTGDVTIQTKSLRM